MKKITFVLLLLIITFYAACSKEKTEAELPSPVENQAPKVSLSQPKGSNGAVWNKLNIEASASDDDGNIASVELFANGISQGKLVQSGTSSTYTTEWDSKSMEDGSVNLTVKATDDEEAVVEATVTIQVYNTLIDYDLYSGYLEEDLDYTYFTYITAPNPKPDEDAEILYFTKITDNASFKAVVERPDGFNEEVFDLHFIEYKKENVKNIGEITSYHNIGPGIFHPTEGSLFDKGADLGKANVTFTSVQEDQDYSIAINNVKPIEENATESFTVFDNFNLGYVYIKVGTVGYYLATPFGPGDHVLPLNEMNNNMQGHIFGGVDVVDVYNLYVAGHISSERLSPSVATYDYGEKTGGNPYETTFHLPKDEDMVFDHYSTTAQLIKDNKTYMHTSYFDILSSMTKLNADFTVADKTLASLAMTVTTNDDFDFISTRSFINVSDDLIFRWISYSGDNNVFFPPIPVEVVLEISDINSSDIVFKEGSITLQVFDYDDYEGYGDYLNRISGRGGVSNSTDRTVRLYVEEKF